MKRLITLLLAFAMLLSLCGCQGGLSGQDSFSEKQGDTMVLIVGRHANARMYSEKVLQDYVLSKLDDCTTYTKNGSKRQAEINLKVIVCDGEPELVPIMLGGEKSDLIFTGTNARKLNQSKSHFEQDLKEFLMSPELRANHEEVDLLKAISLASDYARIDAKNGVKTHLVILDTGITTSGYLNMKKIDIQAGSVDSVLAQLAEGAFYDLSNCELTFWGLGNICVGQKDIGDDNVYKRRLEDLWISYFAACGIEDPDISFYRDDGTPMVCSEGDASSYLRVSSVPFYPTENVIDSGPGGEGNDPPILNASELGFVGGKATFRDPAQAAAAIRSYKSDLSDYLEDSDTMFYVVGSIAVDVPGFSAETHHLSQERADAVKGLLISELNIPADRITTIDAGTRILPWRNGVEFPDGTTASRDDEAMQGNRVVAIIPSTCDKAEYQNALRELLG